MWTSIACVVSKVRSKSGSISSVGNGWILQRKGGTEDGNKMKSKDYKKSTMASHDMLLYCSKCLRVPNKMIAPSRHAPTVAPED